MIEEFRNSGIEELEDRGIQELKKIEYLQSLNS
jgi:hypothetical protein